MKKRRLFCGWLLLLSGWVTADDSATVLTTEHFIYDVIAGDKDIGDIRIDIEYQSDGSRRLLEQSHLQASGWWGKLETRSNYFESYDAEGLLQSVDGKVFDGDGAWWTQIRRVEDQFWAFNSSIKDLSQQEEEQLLGMAVGIAGQFVPTVGEVIGAAQLLFADRKEPSASVRFNSDDFVSSFDNLPFYWAGQGRSLPEQIRLFHSDSLSVTEYRVEQIGQKSELAGYRLQADDAKPILLWFAVSQAGVPHLSRMEAEDDDGLFVISLRDLSGEVQ